MNRDLFDLTVVFFNACSRVKSHINYIKTDNDEIKENINILKDQLDTVRTTVGILIKLAMKEPFNVTKHRD